MTKTKENQFSRNFFSTTFLQGGFYAHNLLLPLQVIEVSQPFPPLEAAAVRVWEKERTSEQRERERVCVWSYKWSETLTVRLSCCNTNKNLSVFLTQTFLENKCCVILLILWLSLWRREWLMKMRASLRFVLGVWWKHIVTIVFLSNAVL